MHIYSDVIHKTRYARYLEDEGRREHWGETVGRYTDYMTEKLKERGYDASGKFMSDIYNAIADHDVMPSMRLMMTAGPACERDNTAAYNCAYIEIDSPKAFDEIMFVLLCGTGIGYSVERRCVSKLPEVPEVLYDAEDTIVVHDSKEGWAKALRKLLAMLWAGEIPRWDLSKIRPAGAVLKTFGGRASGPEPLDDLFKFAVSTFKGAVGRQLTSLECHDLACKVGEVVVVGGVRRSAMISLSDPDDHLMRDCKSGSWWEHNPHRALANNSAAWPERPDVGAFMDEWNALYKSKSGERGLFTRSAAHRQIASTNRREEIAYPGCNPCSEIILRSRQFCNLTEVVIKSDDTFKSVAEKVRIATILGTYQSSLTHFPYLGKRWKKNCEEEALLGVSMTGIFDNMDIMSAENLKKWREIAIETNAEFAPKFGVNVSAAITCVKPSGTVSQLVNSASGMHPRFSQYYIRRVRQDMKDPITQFLIDCGVPHEPDFMKPNQTMVFSFPIKAPDNAVTRDDISALEHLEVWKSLQDHWCEHKPSATINLKEEEWPQAGAWVWEHFDEVSGVSFLPYDGGSYRQAPYEAVDELTYERLIREFPSDIDWGQFIEGEDKTEGSQQLACVAGVCEL